MLYNILGVKRLPVSTIAHVLTFREKAMRNAIINITLSNEILMGTV